MNNTGILILAAGNSSRLGESKQLLPYQGKPLLQHVMDEALQSGAVPVIVVTGADAEKITRKIRTEDVRMVLNEHWQKGMSASIEKGLRTAMEYTEMERIIIAVGDQPFVSSGLFRKIVEIQRESAQPIVACAYADTLGTPVLFTRNYFDVLLNLQGDQGAKKILKANVQHTAIVDFPEGRIDIDTAADVEELSKKQTNRI